MAIATKRFVERYKSSRAMDDLVAFHLGLAPRWEEHQPEIEHKPRISDNPAHQYALILLDTKGALKDVERNDSYSWGGRSVNPVILHAGLQAVTQAFFVGFEKSIHAVPTISSGLHHALHVMDAQQLSEAVQQLQRAYLEVSARLAALELKQVHTEQPDLLHETEDDEPNEKTARLIDQLIHYIHEIGQHFATCFGINAPEVRIVASGQGAELPVTVVIDARSADPAMLAQARVAGARISFYRVLSEVLPPEIWDQTDFEFLFPAYDPA